MLGLHIAFVVLLAGTEAFFTALSVLNVRHAEATVAEERDWLADRLGVDDPDRMLDYQRVKAALSGLQTWTGLPLFLVVLYSGLFADIVGALEATGWPYLVRGTVFFLGVVAVQRVGTVPFDVVDTFVVEELFGFNNRTVRLWVRDLLVGSAVALVITAVLGGAVLAFLRALPGLWWVAAWALFVGFSLVMLVVYPRVIAPLFNDFEPVESGDLHDAVTEVFDRAGFTCSQIYVMDASRRSSKSNAYFIGFGRTKRVVLFDTLVDQLGTREIQGVLAHELAHWKKAHVWKRLGSSALRVGLTLAALHVLVNAAWLYRMFGLPVGVEYAGLLVAGLWVYPLSRLVAPVENRLSIRHEREADAFAVRVMRDGDPLAGALSRLTSENLGNPFPHPLYAAFHYTHPPVPERVRYIRSLSADESGPGPEPGTAGGAGGADSAGGAGGAGDD